MFFTLTDARQNTPCAFVLTGSLPRVVFEQSTPVTVNSNLPSRTAWFSPTALAASPDDEPPPPDDEPPLPDDEDESLPPPLLLATTMMMMMMSAMTARRMKRFFL